MDQTLLVFLKENQSEQIHNMDQINLQTCEKRPDKKNTITSRYYTNCEKNLMCLREYL
jgi:hypothetical protein